MELYRTKVGSEYFGIELEDSDYDILIVDSDVKRKQSIITDKEHIYKLSPAEAIIQLNAFVPVPQYLNSIFPKENSDNPINTYLKLNGERIIKANKKFIFDLMKDFSLFKKSFKKVLPTKEDYEQYPKKIAYRIMLMKSLVKYAETGNFRKSFIPTVEEKEFLKKVRLCQLSDREVLTLYHRLYNQLMRHEHFFSKAQDIEFLKFNVKNLEKIFGITHEDFVTTASSYVRDFPDLKNLF